MAQVASTLGFRFEMTLSPRRYFDLDLQNPEAESQSQSRIFT